MVYDGLLTACEAALEFGIRLSPPACASAAATGSPSEWGEAQCLCAGHSAITGVLAVVGLRKVGRLPPFTPDFPSGPFGMQQEVRVSARSCRESPTHAGGSSGPRRGCTSIHGRGMRRCCLRKPRITFFHPLTDERRMRSSSKAFRNRPFRHQKGRHNALISGADGGRSAKRHQVWSDHSGSFHHNSDWSRV